MAAIMEAIKASGVLVRIHPPDFQRLVAKLDSPLIIRSKGGFFQKKHHYMTSYKGFAFFTKTDDELYLPASAEVIQARSIFIPG